MLKQATGAFSAVCLLAAYPQGTPQIRGFLWPCCMTLLGV